MGEASGVSRVVSSHQVIKPEASGAPRIDADAGGRHDLTDAQWGLLAPLLPELPTTGRPRTYGLRGLVGCSER